MIFAIVQPPLPQAGEGGGEGAGMTAITTQKRFISSLFLRADLATRPWRVLPARKGMEVGMY